METIGKEDRVDTKPQQTRGVFEHHFWAPGASHLTNRDCARNMVAFIRACGIEHQWRADRVDRFTRNCGKPSWRSGDTPDGEVWKLESSDTGFKTRHTFSGLRLTTLP